VSSATKYTKD